MEMYRQVGDLIMDSDGIAKKGVIIRLLALPEGISGTIKTLQFIKENISKNAYLSIMSQYYPTFRAYGYPEISRGISEEEYANVVDEARLLGLNDGWVQNTPKAFDRKFFGTNIEPSSESDKNVR